MKLPKSLKVQKMVDAASNKIDEAKHILEEQLETFENNLEDKDGNKGILANIAQLVRAKK